MKLHKVAEARFPEFFKKPLPKAQVACKTKRIIEGDSSMMRVLCQSEGGDKMNDKTQKLMEFIKVTLETLRVLAELATAIAKLLERL